MSAKLGDDYEEAEGVLEFKSGEMEKHITITLKQTPDKEPDENFRVTLAEVSPGAKLGHTKATVVTIVGDAEFKSMVNRVMAKTHIALKSVSNSCTKYSKIFTVSQFVLSRFHFI